MTGRRSRRGLKTLDDAFDIRRRILLAFEAAEGRPTRRAAPPGSTFVAIGAGPTGVEMAGTLAEIARHTLPSEFRRIDPASAKIVLLEGGPRVLQAMPNDLSQRALEQLRDLGVEVRLNERVVAIDASGLDVQPSEGAGYRIVSIRPASPGPLAWPHHPWAGCSRTQPARKPTAQGAWWWSRI